MKHELEAVWERYVLAWKVAGLAEKQASLRDSVAPGCTYTDPLTRAQGWDELIAYMLDFHRQAPGAHFVTEHFSTHHKKSLAKWRMVDAAAIKIGEGTSYGEYDDQNRLIAMTGFFEIPTG